MKNLIPFGLILITLLSSCGDRPPKEDEDHVIGERSFTDKIIYMRVLDEGSDDYEIFIMDQDGKNQKNLTNSPGMDWAYHTFDDNIFFVSDRGTTKGHYYLYVMKSNGKGVQKITDFRMADSWLSSRKEGTELIVKPHSSVDSAFYIINLSGEIQAKVYSNYPNSSSPCFSPDGKQIVFRRGGTKLDKLAGFVDELFIMNEDGSNPKQITNYPADDNTAEWFNYHAGPPTWNARSNRITYTSLQRGSHSIFAIMPDGSFLRQISDDGFHQGWHDWSPDGKEIVFDGSDTTADSDFNIFIMKNNGSDVRQLTDDPVFEQAPLFVRVYD